MLTINSILILVFIIILLILVCCYECYNKGYRKGMRVGYHRCNILFLEFREHTLEYNKTILRNLSNCQQLLNNILRR